MSGLYNAIFGQNPASDVLLKILNLERGDFGRFRDAYVSEGKICVYTRCGGGNREGYESVFEEMAEHPLFIEDRDDDFDCTYCTFFFNAPDEYKEDLAKIDQGKVDMSERWINMIESIKTAEPPKSA